MGLAGMSGSQQDEKDVQVEGGLVQGTQGPGSEESMPTERWPGVGCRSPQTE